MRRTLLVFMSAFVSGCVSQVASFQDHIESWKGEPISDYLESRGLPHADRSDYVGQERVIELEDGNLLYEFPYPYCPVFFEVNTDGMIVNIKSENNEICY